MEFELWKVKWTNVSQPGIKTSLIELLQGIDEDLYPGISKILTVLVTIPVSSGMKSF